MKMKYAAVIAIAVMALLALSIGVASANFVAYNDCVKPQATKGPTTWFPQMPNVNYLGIGGVNGTWDPCPLPASGELVDWNTGLGTGITATMFQSGGVVYMTNPSYPGYWEGPAYPYSGYDNPPATDAGSIFCPWTASIRGCEQYGSSGWYVTITLAGMDPAKTYEFVTSANRSEYNDRFGKFSISGAEDVANTSSQNAVVGDGGLSTTICTGNNFANGQVARWTFKSGTDGTVVFRAENGGTTNIKGYAFSAFRLRDITASKISGHVIDAAGNPIAGALVVASKRANALAAPNYAQAQTNTDGYYEMTCLDAATYHVAAWAKGWHASDEVTTAISSDTDTKTVDLTLRAEGLNKAIGAAVSSNNSGSGAPANAIDGVTGVSPLAMYGHSLGGTQFTSSTAAGQDVNTVHTQLLLDRGANCKATEMVVYWDWAWARGYKIQCLPDGYNSAVDSTDWETYGATLFQTDTGRPGLVNKVPGTIPALTSGSVPAFDPIHYVDVYRFSEQNARYWRIYATNTINKTYVGIQDVELHDDVPPTAIGAAKSLPVDSQVCMLGQRVTLGPGGSVPANIAYIEASDRSSGIRIDTSALSAATVSFGDVVDISGSVKVNGNQEKYIAVDAIQKHSPAGPLDALGMNNRFAASQMSQGLFVKLWGKVSNVLGDSFTITDGSNTPIKVYCGSMSKPVDGQNIRVRGVLSVEGGNPVLLMRDEAVDWTDASAAYQPLPLNGAYKYVSDWLVVGPFADAQSVTDRNWRITNDWIKAATGVAEADVRPTEGMDCGDKKWTRLHTGENVDFTKWITNTAQNTNCTCYAHCYIWSPIAQAVTFRIGSDDWAYVYINGEWLYATDPVAFPTGRPEIWGQDVSYGTLQPGLNSVLIKVENGTVSYGFDFAFSSTTGDSGYGNITPIPGLGYVLSP